MSSELDIIFVPPEDDDQDVTYVDNSLAEASRDSVESGVFDLDTDAPPKRQTIFCVRKPRTLNSFVIRSNSQIQKDAAEKRASKDAPPAKRQAQIQPCVADQIRAINTVSAAEASLYRIVRLAADNGLRFNAEKLLVLKKLCEGGSLSVEGKPGTAKTSTLAFALDELPDTWIFSNAGIAAENLLEAYAGQRGLDVKRARFDLRQRNIIIKHYDSFFAILPHFRSYSDWEHNTMKPTLANLLEFFRTPPKRIIFEEACNIPSAKYDMINKICNRMAKEVHDEKVRAGAPARDYIPRYMACDAVCYFGDPRQLVPMDPVSGEPDRLMESVPFKTLINPKNNLGLTKIERQTDPVFQNVVSLIGDGEVNDEVQLFMRTLKVVPSPGKDDGVVICPYRAQARRHNDRIIDAMAASDAQTEQERIRSFAVVCQYDTLADGKIRKRVRGAEAPEEPKTKRPTNWEDVTPENNSALYRRIMVQGKHDAEARKSDLKEMAKPTRLKFGTTCIFGTNHKKYEHLVNGTRVVIVGWHKKTNMPIVSLKNIAEEYREEHGVYGYDPEGLKTGVTIVVPYTTSRFTVVMPKTPATETTPAIPGKSFVCKKIEMKLKPAYAFTAHKVQGKTIERTVIDPSPARQFAPGLLFVALTRSVHRPALLEPICPNFTVNVDKKAIATCKEIEANMKNLCEENGIEWDL